MTELTQMPAVRQMTVKRALTRLKTIEAQLQTALETIRQAGAVSSKEKIAIVNTKTTLAENHKLAEAKVSEALQQYNDLLNEYTKIKLAIAKSNLETFIDVSGKQMSIHEALLVENSSKGMMSNLVRTFANSVTQAERKVEMNNNKLNTDDAVAYEALKAEVEYLAPFESILNVKKFVDEFTVLVHGLIDEANITTLITLD